MCAVEECEPWAVVTDKKVRARKNHQCTECYRTIKSGEEYYQVKGLIAGQGWYLHRICSHCDALGDIMRVMCSGWPLDRLQDELREHWAEGYRSIPFGRLIAQQRLKWHDGRDPVPLHAHDVAVALMG